jgi:uncharacterized damage-inducible protein DinB
MTMTDAVLPEYDHEMGTTRKLLERLPQERFGWKPHDKSMSLGRLATHLAEMPAWGSTVLNQDVFDMSPDSYVPREEATRADVLKLFDNNVAAARALFASKSDAELMASWTFKSNGQVMFSMPKIAVIRSMVLNHMVHHRGQLSVYLRMQNVPLPAMYGPSADEQR